LDREANNDEKAENKPQYKEDEERLESEEKGQWVDGVGKRVVMRLSKRLL
jgi:hypothetical protein